VSTVLKGI